MVEFSGFDEFHEDIEKLKKRAEQLEGEREVSFGELFSNEFMSENTSYINIDDFLEAIDIKNEEDFQKLPQQTLEDHVIKSTRFKSFEEMQQAGVEEYIVRQLGLG